MTQNSAFNENLIDAHVHLNAVKQIDRAIQAAGSVGVTQIVAVGMDLKSKLIR